MRLQSPLSVVTPTLDADVLTVLAGASRAFTAGELHRLVGARSVSGIRKALQRLDGEGIVTSDTVGNAITYRLNDDHLAAPAIKELAGLRSTYFVRLRGEFAGWATAPVFAAVFGSAARGEMDSSSDVDLFVVRPDELDDDTRGLWDQSVQVLQQRASRWTGNDVRVLEMAESEVAANLRVDPVLGSVRRDEVVLHGSSDFWRRARAEDSELHPGDA